MSEMFPHLVHIEETSFNHPVMTHVGQLYNRDGEYNFTNNYSIHLYKKQNHFIPTNVEELQGYNCTVGNVMRYVLYGSPALRSRKTTYGYLHIWNRTNYRTL